MTNSYITEGSRIIISKGGEFDAAGTALCGQVFRYNVTPNYVSFFSRGEYAEVYTRNGRQEIECTSPEYFARYFDLGTDYALIKNKLSAFSELCPAMEYGGGIRILRQDPFETVVSFIISANNNIPRIRKIIERICEAAGERTQNGYAFPQPFQLRHIHADGFFVAGAGYRAPYLASSAEKLADGSFLEACLALETPALKNKLLTLYGVGNKVADCVLLFGFARRDVFPADVWMRRWYNSFTGKTAGAAEASRELAARYGALAGFAQQYLFYWFRTLSGGDTVGNSFSAAKGE